MFLEPFPITLAAKVMAVQRPSARVVFNIPLTSKASTTTDMLRRLDWETVEDRRLRRRTCLFCAMHYPSHTTLNTRLPITRRHGLQYRQEHHKAHMSTFFILTSKTWNRLDNPPPTSPTIPNPMILPGYLPLKRITECYITDVFYVMKW